MGVSLSNKKMLARQLWLLKRVKTWQLVIIFIIAAFLSATFLRLNNLGMIERREAVIEADKRGDERAIIRSLGALQEYVSSHMNTDLQNGVYLQYSYERARDKVLDNASNASNPNSKVYQRASVECRARWQGGVDSFRNDYVQCVIDRVKSLREGQDALSSLHLPRADMYRHVFISPLWTPDFAGFSVLFCLLILLLIAFRLVAAAVLRILLHRRYQGV
ncbi:MAG TPA: hypothetical protein VFZ48_05935 [Candidatus Saccharimonadales bacterium]